MDTFEPALIVMFNAPFELSRIAVDVAAARVDMTGGFSLTVWTDIAGDRESWRPSISGQGHRLESDR